MVVLGITAYYHDSSAALIVNGKIVAGALEERFSRKKHDNPGSRFWLFSFVWNTQEYH